MHLLQVDSFIFNCRPSNVDVKAFGGNGFVDLRFTCGSTNWFNVRMKFEQYNVSEISLSRYNTESTSV